MKSDVEYIEETLVCESIMPERIKPGCQYNLSNTSSIYLQIYALGRGKKSTKRKKFHEEQKDHKCKQAYFHFPTFPKLLLVLVPILFSLNWYLLYII